MTPWYKVRENNKSPFSYSFTSRYASHLRYFSYDLAIFISFSPFSFYETARLFKNCSFFKICAFIIAFKRNINSRIYPTEKCREKHGVIRHLDALIWPTLSKRFAFALYQPWLWVIHLKDDSISKRNSRLVETWASVFNNARSHRSQPALKKLSLLHISIQKS